MATCRGTRTSGLGVYKGELLLWKKKKKSPNKLEKGRGGLNEKMGRVKGDGAGRRTGKGSGGGKQGGGGDRGSQGKGRERESPPGRVQRRFPAENLIRDLGFCCFLSLPRG